MDYLLLPTIISGCWYKPLLVSIFFKLILSFCAGFIGYLKYYNINVTRTAEGRFEEAVIDYLFTVYLVPIFVNILALYEAKKQANVLTQMVSFERIYTRMFKKRIGFDLGSKPLVMTVVLLILGCGVMVITHFSMANFIIYQVTKDYSLKYAKHICSLLFQVVPYCYINVITFIIGGAWYIYCDIIGNIATCLAEEFQFALRNIEYSNRVCDYRSLWMILSKIIRNVGNSFGYTLTFLCLYLFFVITLTVYGLLSQIQEGMGVKDIGLTITGVSATLMLYFICDEAHYASTCVRTYFQKKILLVELSFMNEDAQQEISMFLRATEMNPTDMCLCGFFDVNRNLFKSLLATMVTYLVVLLQFQISIPSSGDDVTNNTTNTTPSAPK
uniref:Gustatory receptor n=1 Tax=Dendroctonus ponderosae TaxID=77166 RepID=A0AAR5P3F8_DENPD